MSEIKTAGSHKRQRSSSEAFLPTSKKQHCESATAAASLQYNPFRAELTNCELDESDHGNTSFIPKLHHRRIFSKARSNTEGKNPQSVHDAVGLSGLSSSPELKRSARHGGPDLSDLRGYHQAFHSTSSQPSTAAKSRKRASEDTGSSSTRSSKKPSPHHRNFQQKLIDGGVYPFAYRHPDGTVPIPPSNWASINEVLAKPRPSLSPSQFSPEAFEEFVQADADAFKEKQVVSSVIPKIEGKLKDGKCVAGGIPLTNLEQLTDGPFAPGNTDHFYGARPEQLQRTVRDELHHQIIPSTQHELPMAPNFFLAVKGPDGSAAVMKKQACYDGALGSRGMHALQVYGKIPTYDNCAYTFTSTYHDGTLKMFTSHPVEPKAGEPPRYYMHQIDCFAMTGNRDVFRKGATLYRNAREEAEKMRNAFIDAANERAQCRGDNSRSESADSISREDASTPVSEPEASSPDTSQDEDNFYDAKQ